MKERRFSFKSAQTAMDLNLQRRKAAASSYGYIKLPKGMKVFKEEEGKPCLDFVPYLIKNERHLDVRLGGLNVGEPWYRLPFLVHKNIGDDRESVVCPKTFSDKCPICEYLQSHRQELTKEDAAALRPQRRNLYIVIPLKHKDYDEVMYIWDVAHANFEKTLELEMEENPEIKGFYDPIEGKSLRIRFDEETFNKNKFYKANRIYTEKREPYDEAIIDDAPVLDELLTILPYDEIHKKWWNLEQEEIIDKAEDKIVEQEVSTAKYRSKYRQAPGQNDLVKASEKKHENNKMETKQSLVRKAAAPPQNGQCPSGYQFGIDTNKHDECGICPKWDDCIEEKERREKQ